MRLTAPIKIALVVVFLLGDLALSWWLIKPKAGELIPGPNRPSPLPLEVDSKKLQESQLEMKTLTQNDKGEAIITQDAIVKRVAERGRRLMVRLQNDDREVEVKVLPATLFGQVTSYDFDQQGYIVGLSIGSAGLAEFDQVAVGDKIRVIYAQKEEKLNQITAQKIVLYLKK